MAVAVAIYLAFNAGRPSAHGWGVAMSTDTAFALGVLALVGPRFPDRLRAFMLTVVVVDDIVALVVIATVYTERRHGRAAGCSRRRALRRRSSSCAGAAACAVGLVYFALGVGAWVALLEVGRRAGRGRARDGPARLRLPGVALRPRARDRAVPRVPRAADRRARALGGAGSGPAISPNERLQQLYHPWTSYVIVPLFALANAGIAIDGGFLARAFTSPITLGILFGYVVGKPVGIVGSAWLLTRLSRGRLRPPVGWAAVAGGGTIAGIGFTVSLLIATLAFDGTQLEEAKLGILGAALGASLVTWLLFRATALLPRRLRDPRAARHRRAARRPRTSTSTPSATTSAARIDAPVTVVEYGDFECPYCGQAEPVVRELLRDFGDVRYVWRHLPLNDVHPHAQLAAEAAEAAAAQGAFWEMHDLLLDHQDALRPSDLIGYAEQLGLDVERFTSDLREHAGAARVAEDVDSADLSGVSGTPTFFINGRRHYGAYDIATLSAAVRAAGARAVLGDATSN